MLVRPCFLIVDREFAGSISTRKLVIETAKFNVITVYSCPEATATLRLFPNVSGVVIDAAAHDGSCEAFLTGLRANYAAIKLILVGHETAGTVTPDLIVDSFAPDKLLKGLRKLFPEDTAALLQTEAELQEKATELL